ncbi:MAG: hypothetical protein NT062_33770 [Proteobacteria bacterium]|nr:hypothetical protein [Pseudomonadota bacterium]
MMRVGFALPLLAMLGACADEPRATPRAPVDLRAALATPDATPVGVAVAPDGERFVFDETRGLFQLDALDRATLVVALDALPAPSDGPPVVLPITDIVALAPHLFAITAIGDGFLLDTAAMTLQQHFCYVPDSLPQNLTQRTDAIAFDAAHDRLYAQPRTLGRPPPVRRHVDRRPRPRRHARHADRRRPTGRCDRRDPARRPRALGYASITTSVVGRA